MMYSHIMLLLVRSEVPGSSGYFQMSSANWGNPSQWPFERLEVGCFIAGIVFKNITVRGERRIMSSAFSPTATKGKGGENIVKKNMSFSKWVRGEPIMCSSAVGLFGFHSHDPHLPQAESLTFSTVALNCAAFVWSENVQMRFVLWSCLFLYLLGYFPGSIANLSIVAWFAMEQWTLLFLAKSSSVKCYVIQINRAPTAVQKGQCCFY